MKTNALVAALFLACLPVFAGATTSMVVVAAGAGGSGRSCTLALNFGIAMLGNGGFLGKNFATGKDVAIAGGKALAASVDSTIHLESVQPGPSDRVLGIRTSRSERVTRAVM